MSQNNGRLSHHGNLQTHSCCQNPSSSMSRCMLIPFRRAAGGSPFIKVSLLSPSVLLYPGCDHRQPELNSACQSKKEDSFRRMDYPELFLQMETSSCFLSMVRARWVPFDLYFFGHGSKKRT